MTNTRAYRKTIAAVFSGAMLVILVGCSPYSTFHGGAVLQDATAALETNEHVGTATIDFDKLVSGAWTRLIIACYPTTPSQLETSLGFSWPSAPDIASPSGNSFALLIFATDSEVEDYLDIGQHDFDEHSYYFTTCPDSETAQRRLDKPLVIRRESAQLQFVFSSAMPDWPYWYIPQSAWDELAPAAQ